MKIKTIRFKKKPELSSEQEREVKNMIIMIALFAAGMIVGAGIIKKGSSTELLDDFTSIFNIYIDHRNTLNAFKLFVNAFIVNLILIAADFCAGMSCIGMPVTVIIPIFKGVGYGVLSGYLFIQYAMNGIGYYLLTVFPSAVIASSVLLLSSSSASIMSKEILSVTLEKKQPDSTIAIKYIKRYAVYFAGIVLASAVETILIKAFSYLFVF